MTFKQFIEGMDASMIGDLSQTFSNSDGGFEESGITSKYFTKKLPSNKSNFDIEKIYGKFSKLRAKKRK